MKTSKIIAAAAFTSLLAVAGVAQAETYHGVLAPVSALSRADVAAEAVAAAHNPDPYAESASSRVQPVLASSLDRATVRAQAVAKAHAPNQNLDAKAFVNSEIPAQYQIQNATATRQAGL